MSTAAPLQNAAAKAPNVSKSPHAGSLLQRKCACGGLPGVSGECMECQSKRLQRKLAIGSSNDPLEAEADRVAEQVLAAPAHSAVSGSPPRIQRSAGQATGDAGTAPASVERVLSSAGRPIEPALRQDMEQRFGHDFSSVQVHTDSQAARRTDELGALAYTVANEISFAAGAHKPETSFGRALLAHELAHVVQKAEGRDTRDTPRRSAVINAAHFTVTNTPSSSIVVAPFIPGKWFINLVTDKPGITLDSGVNVSCGSGAAAGYEVGIVQVETREFSEASYFGLTPADGSLIARKSQLRKPSGPCVDSRTGAFWTADGSGEKSLKPPACGTNVALPIFSDFPSESYPGWKENSLTHKPNYVRDIKMEMEFVDALGVKTPSGKVNVLKWLRWGVNWAGKFNSNASGSKPTGISMGGGFWHFGDDSIRPPAIPSTYTIPAKTCVEIAGEATGMDYVVETNGSY